MNVYIYIYIYIYIVRDMLFWYICLVPPKFMLYICLVFMFSLVLSLEKGHMETNVVKM